MFAAEVEHLLSFVDPTDQGTGQAATTHDQRKRFHRNRFGRNSHNHQRPIPLEKIEIPIIVDPRRNRIHDQIKRTGQLLERLRIGSGVKMIRAHAQPVFFFLQCLTRER